MTADQVTALFTRKDGTFLFARWGRPIVPVVFGVEDETLPVIKGAIEAVVVLAGHKMDEVDTELGANLMVFFCSEWDEIGEVPHLERLIPELADLLVRLKGAGANQYRVFRFDETGAIQAAFVFVRMDAHLQAVSAETLALSQAVQVILLWSDAAFLENSPLLVGPQGQVMLKPEIADVVRAGYDPVLPAVARDASFGLRLSARMVRPS